MVDESYNHFVEADKLPSAIPLATSRDNVAVVRTFSKVYGMPAIRLGYCVSGQKIQSEMRKHEAGGPNMLAIMAGTESVKDMDHVQRSREVAWAFRKRCYEELDKMGLEYIPAHGTFMMIDLNRPAAPIVKELRNRNVLVGTRGQGLGGRQSWIRVSAGTRDETDVFLQTLKDVMAS